MRGHGFRPRKEVAVFETRDGWARVSGFFDPERLRANFGNRLPEKPAYWVSVRALANSDLEVTAEETEAQPEAETAETEETAAAKPPRQQRQKRLVTTPKFRPGTQFASLAQPAKTEQTTSNSDDSETVADDANSGSATVADDTPDNTTAPEASPQPETAQENQDSGAQTSTANADAVEETQEAGEQVAADAVEQVVAAAEAEEASEENASFYSPPKAEYDGQGAGVETTVSPSEETAKSASVVLEETQTAMNDSEAASGTDGSASAAPSDSNSDAIDANEASAQAEPAASSGPAEPTTPTFKAEKIDPLTIGERPDTLTKALLDKRLSKLPGRKSKSFKKEEVIAMRHHALTLLANGECSGIERGGRSAVQAGMLFVVCSDDPTYLHQFPLEEMSW